MKEAVGELNMTVIVIIAIAAIAGLFLLVMWPQISNWIQDTFGQVRNIEPCGTTPGNPC